MKYDYLIYLFLAFSISKVHSSYFDYIYPYSEPSFSNYGSLGLIQNPNARFLSEGFTALSWSHNEPYLRGSIIAYPFNWMEASFQYTDLNNALYSPYPDFSGSQSLKDKSFDVKFRVIKESNLMPSVAVGLRDIGGTGLFASEYIVFSKYIYENIDATIGIGWGNLNGGESIGNPLKHFGQRFENRDPDFGLGGKLSTDSFFAGDAGIFAGLEIFIPRLKGVRVKLEFDGTNYDTEGVEPLAQNSRTNIGLLFPISDYFNLKLSSTRGNTINFGFSYKVNLSKNNVLNQRKEKRNNIKDSSIIKKVANQNNENLYKASIKYLSEEGFYLQKAELEDDSYRLEYAQKKFRNPVIASGRVTAILDEIIPDKVTDFEISLVNGGIGVNKVRVARDEYQRVRDAYADPDLLSYSIEVEPYNPNNEKYDFSPEIEYPRFFSSLSPDLRTQIGGPDGFFFGDLKITSSSELLLNRNLSLITVASYGIYNNLDELKLPSDSILPHVRTEIVNYLKESRRFSIRRMQLNKFGQYGNSLYYKFSAGILESMFGGVGFEGLFKPFNKDYAIGIDIWDVKQRAYNQMFDFQDYRTLTGHLTFYYLEPENNILFKLKGGRYLAKDAGFTFDVSRVFNSGFRVGAFFTLTDISAAEFGEGSFDKGFYFWVPIDIFSGNYFKRTFGWGLRPITRDGGQSIIHGYPLWGVLDQAHKRFYDQEIFRFYE